MCSILLPVGCGQNRAIVCSHVIQHGKLAEVRQTFSEMRRVLYLGGHLIPIAVSTKDSKRFTGKATQLTNSMCACAEVSEITALEYSTETTAVQQLLDLKSLPLT